MVLNIKKEFTICFEEISPTRAKQMPPKVLFVGEKTRWPPVRSLRAKIVTVVTSK